MVVTLENSWRPKGISKINIFRHFPESEALQIIKDVVSGLQEMVTNNIIHRDLKPANIIKHNACYKITDFGFSRNFDSLQMM